MEGNTNIRASDADRDQVAAALREHLAAGRLTPEEFDERLGQAFAAKTLGDLQDLMADLPDTDLEPFQDTPRQLTTGPVERRPVGFGPAWRAVWRTWLVITLIFFVLWLFSGAADGPWFVYLAVIAGVVMLLHRRRGPPHHHEHQVQTRGDDEELDD